MEEQRMITGSHDLHEEKEDQAQDTSDNMGTVMIKQSSKFSL